MWTLDLSPVIAGWRVRSGKGWGALVKETEPRLERIQKQPLAPQEDASIHEELDELAKYMAMLRHKAAYAQTLQVLITIRYHTYAIRAPPD